MIVAGMAIALVAALFHAYVFWLESVVWTSSRARAAFGTSPEDAATTRVLAFNQGFYNLFLTIECLLGIALYALGHTAVGATLVIVGTASMAAAGIVLVASQPSKARAAALQAGPALVAIALVSGGLLAS